MFRALRLLIAAIVGAAVGLGSAWLALNDERLNLASRVGVWEIAAGPTPNVGDPYTRARAARAGTIALGAAEGVAFVASTDSGGAPLDPDCHYGIEGPVPAGDLWTLAVTDEDGRPPKNPAGRIGFTSRAVIRQADGTVEIIAGRTARPGNFVPIGYLDSLRFTLRVYSSRLAGGLPAAAAMPRITRLECSQERRDVR